MVSFGKDVCKSCEKTLLPPLHSFLRKKTHYLLFFWLEFWTSSGSGLPVVPTRSSKSTMGGGEKEAEEKRGGNFKSVNDWCKCILREFMCHNICQYSRRGWRDNKEKYRSRLCGSWAVRMDDASGCFLNWERMSQCRFCDGARGIQHGSHSFPNSN